MDIPLLSLSSLEGGGIDFGGIQGAGKAGGGGEARDEDFDARTERGNAPQTSFSTIGDQSEQY